MHDRLKKKKQPPGVLCTFGVPISLILHHPTLHTLTSLSSPTSCKRTFALDIDSFFFKELPEVLPTCRPRSIVF